jgi:hypothetical protein
MPRKAGKMFVGLVLLEPADSDATGEDDAGRFGVNDRNLNAPAD